jgi:cell division protein ZipA
LIGILVILILLILADGVRRMIRERHGRLRMRIDRRFGKGPAADDDSDDDYPNELIGRPRVRSRAEQARIDMDGVDEDGDRADPPIMMDTAEAPPETPTRRAEQQTLFDADNGDDDTGASESPVAGSAKAGAATSGSAASGVTDTDDVDEPPARPVTRRPEAAGSQREELRREESRKQSGTRQSAPRPSAARQEPKPKDPGPVLEVIVFHLIARRPERFDGQEMLRLLLENGLRYGDMHIFHRHRDVDGREQLEFSVANAVEPGTFDIDTMEEEQFAGITFFMKLPGPRDPLASLERMLTAGRRLAEGLNGDLKDEQHSVLTPQTMEHLRQRVQEFERRQRVSHGA